MKTLFLVISAWLLALPFRAQADTFFLKDGSTVEGSIVREDESSYVVDVQVTKSIKDERILAKADVTKVQRQKPDLIAFPAIAELVPAPDSLTADQYAARIRAVEKFLSEHRGSSKTPDAREILATLKAEANEILAGGIKLNGKIVPPSEYRANAYEFDARAKEAEIRALIKEARYLAALRAFSEFDRDFRSTVPRAALAPLITQVMNTYLAEISQLLVSYEARLKQRQSGLEQMNLADRRRTETAIAEETAGLAARFKAEKEAKTGWVTTHPFFKPSLDETMTFGKQEIARLAAGGGVSAIDGGKAYRDALQKIQSGADKAAVTAAISDARTAMVPANYIAVLEAAAANR